MYGVSKKQALTLDLEAIKIKEDYAKKQEEIQKKIDAGITWEFEKKSEQVEETKTFVKEQADLLKVANNEMLAIQETASTEKVNIEKEVTEKLASIRAHYKNYPFRNNFEYEEDSIQTKSL
jgi:hypothetical protein